MSSPIVTTAPVSRLGKVNPKTEFYILCTFGFSILLFLGLFFLWLGTTYNYDTSGNLIKDDTYKNANTLQIIYLVFLGISIPSGYLYFSN